MISNKEAEQGIIGSCLCPSTSNVAPMDIAVDAGCNPSWFYYPAHRHAWEVMYALHMDGKPVDMLTVSSKTDDYEILEQSVDVVVVSSHLEHHLSEAEKAHKRRCAEDIALDVQQSVADADCDISMIVAKAGDALDSLVSNRERKTVREHMMDNIKVLMDAMAGKGSGLPLPWAKFSERTGGIQVKSVCPLVGRDGKGKSGASAQIADHWAGEGIPTLYISLEDDPRRTLLRMAGCRKWFSARETEQASSWMGGKRTPYCQSEANKRERQLLEYTDWLEGKRVEVIDGDFTGEQIITEVKAFRRRHGIKDDEAIGVIVDGFKDLTPSDGDSTTAQEKHTAQQLFKAAKRGNAGLIVVSHIVKIDDGVPIRKENIKGSGTQFQGARQVLIFQDAGIPEIVDEDHFVLSATKANFAQGGSAVLRRDENVLSYQEVSR